MKKNALVLIFALFALFSCKKKEDQTLPEISNFGFSSALITEFDTIQVSARVSDNEKIESIQIVISELLGSEAIVRKIQTVQVSGNPTDFLEDVEISWPDLKSGKYDLKVLVSDGENEKSAIQRVEIFERSREFEGIYYLNKSTNVFGFINSSHQTKILLESAPYMDGVFNDHGQEMVFLTSDRLQLVAHAAGDMHQEWSFGVGGTSIVDFKFDRSDHNFYVAGSDSRIRTVGEHGGLIRTSSQMNGGKKILIMGVARDYMMTYTKNEVGSDFALETYHKLTGTFTDSWPVTGRIDAIVGIARNVFITISKTQTGYVFHRYDIDAQTVVKLGNERPENLDGLKIIHTEEFKILLKAGGKIYYMFPANGTFGELADADNGACYDDMFDTMYFGYEGLIYSMIPSTAYSPQVYMTFTNQPYLLWVKHNKEK